jgi:hypothetical protein
MIIEIKKIQDALTPELLSPFWKKRVKPGDHPITGHCYLAAEVLYHYWGKQRGFKPKVISFGHGITHWFLEHQDGRIADPSSEQFGSDPIPYARGKGCAFLTQHPSRRAQIVLGRLDFDFSRRKIWKDTEIA